MEDAEASGEEVVDTPDDRPIRSFKQLSEQEKVEILRAETAGLSYREIGRNFNRDHKTIAKFCKKYSATNSLDRKKGSGRKRKTTEREDRSIMIYVKRHRFCTSRDIKAALALPSLSFRTICARIKESGEFNSC